MPSLSLTDPITATEVLADSVNNRRSQIETVVNSLDDVNFGAGFPTRIDDTDNDLGLAAGMVGEMGLIKVGSSQFDYRHAHSRLNTIASPENQWLTGFHPIFTQNEAWEGSSLGGPTFFPDTTGTIGLIPNAKVYMDAGWQLNIMVGGVMTMNMSADGDCGLKVGMFLADLNDGDTAASPGSTNPIFAVSQSGSDNISLSIANYTGAVPYSPIKDHVELRLVAYDITATQFVNGWTYERFSVSYGWNSVS